MIFLLQAGVLVSNAPAHHFQAATAPADHFLGEPSKLIMVKNFCLPIPLSHLISVLFWLDLKFIFNVLCVDATLWADNSVSHTKS